METLVAVVKLYAEKMFELYLGNVKIKDVTEYIPNTARKPIRNQNFANRMQAYLNRIMEPSRFAEENLNMQSEHGKVIYPERIRREVGAKLVYDTMCSVAASVFYGFSQNQSVYGNMVAEDTVNSYEKCKQIADVALELEKDIKKLTERELKSTDVLKAIVSKAFADKEKISAMVKGDNKDILVDKVMELVREVFL